MTEAEWWSCRDSDRLFDHLDADGTTSERKLRLFAVAACRRVVRLCPEPSVSDTILDSIELFADGLVPPQELTDAYGVWGVVEHRFAGDDSVEMLPGVCFHALQAVGQAVSLDEVDCPYRNRMRDVTLHVANAIAFTAVESADVDESEARWGRGEKAERAVLAALVREAFGNPFRPVAFLPAWRTADVKLLARGVYLEKAFDRLPILADALQDAGCDCDELLNHLRDITAPHVRGCWALDSVLGKE